MERKQRDELLRGSHISLGLIEQQNPMMFCRRKSAFGDHTAWNVHGARVS